MKNKIVIVDDKSIDLLAGVSYTKVIKLDTYQKPLRYEDYIVKCCNKIHVTIKKNKNKANIDIILANQFSNDIVNKFKNYHFSKLNNVKIHLV